MSSSAYQTFTKNMDTVHRMFEAYSIIDTYHNPAPKRGKRALDHITRAAEVFLVSTFEVYLEDLLLESANIHISYAHYFSSLPTTIQQKIHHIPRLHHNEKWIQKYRRIVIAQRTAFNTPKIDNIVELFQDNIGLDPNDIRAIINSGVIDGIVRYRGEIVHRVRAKDYVKIDHVQDDQNNIEDFVKRFDNLTRESLHSAYPNKRVPWNLIHI